MGVKTCGTYSKLATNRTLWISLVYMCVCQKKRLGFVAGETRWPTWVDGYTPRMGDCSGNDLEPVSE